ncbi:hypothetical protein [Kitasatospora purpeofusca]|uniref:hypothetical protein n=1 Tax=Kitasatospora purpeofusca TaxID=67352 RepID=UPI0036D32BAF
MTDLARKRTGDYRRLREKGINLHDLRHAAAGVPLAVISETLRHSNLAITADLYGHFLKESTDEASLALAKALDHADTLHPDATTTLIPNTCPFSSASTCGTSSCR